MDRTQFKTDKLRGRAVEMYGSIDKLAEALDWNVATLGGKIRGKTDFKVSEVATLIKALKIPEKEVASYFLEEK